MNDVPRKIIKKIAESIVKSTNNKVILFTKDLSDLLNKLSQSEDKEERKQSKIVKVIKKEKRFDRIHDHQVIRSAASKGGDGNDEITMEKERHEVKDETTSQKDKSTLSDARNTSVISKQTKTVSNESINLRTSLILDSIKASTTITSLLKRLENLNFHLKQYPDGAHFAVKIGALKELLKLRRDHTNSNILQEVNEMLSLLGYCDPPSSPGVRVLAIDGGGMRGLVVIHILQQLELLSGRKVHQLFDYVCGVSTGAIIAFCSIPPIIVPLETLRDLYLELGKQIFKQSAIKGASKLVFNSAYYETSLWERLLKEYVGTTTLLETTRYPECPRISVLSTVGSRVRVVPFLFRNYSTPTKNPNDYPGSCNHTVFEAVRASSAAPSVFEEFRTESHSHLDGGIVANNPAGVAIHEVKTLWPDESISCVVSCGTGLHPPDSERSNKSSSWKRIVDKVLESATDTEGVHQILNDLLSENVYHRFNPLLSNTFAVDEVSEEKITHLEEDTAAYCRRNEDKFVFVVKKLTEPRSVLSKLSDYINMQIKLNK